MINQPTPIFVLAMLDVLRWMIGLLIASLAAHIMMPIVVAG